MKFLVDAHLPPSLCRVLKERGHDTIHTSSLPHGNATQDAEVRTVAAAEGRVLVTKDIDFFDELILKGAPPKLVLVRCGNLRKNDLLELFLAELDTIVSGLRDNDLIELGKPE